MAAELPTLLTVLEFLHRPSFGWNEQPTELKMVWISAKWKTVNAFTYSHAVKYTINRIQYIFQ